MKWTSVLAIVTVVGAVGCSKMEVEPPAPEPPKATSTKSTEPAPYQEPENTAYAEACKAILAELAEKNSADHWALPENSGFATISHDVKDANLFQVSIKAKRKDMDVERTFQVILHQDKITKAWVIDLTNVAKGGKL